MYVVFPVHFSNFFILGLCLVTEVIISADSEDNKKKNIEWPHQCPWGLFDTSPGRFMNNNQKTHFFWSYISVRKRKFKQQNLRFKNDSLTFIISLCEYSWSSRWLIFLIIPAYHRDSMYFSKDSLCVWLEKDGHIVFAKGSRTGPRE